MVSYDVKRVTKGTESFMVSFDFTKTPITQIADYIIIAASKHKASDIHFDPREEGMMVRFRIDGDCQDYTYVPKAYEKNLTTRLKLLANMNITETRLPQDGAIKGDYGGTYLDMRVSVLPVNEGEKVVVRILDYSRSLSGIESLGFHPQNLEKIKRMMNIPNGIILTTGATGSGKTTTNYSILQGLNKPETNIITVEDPIEMNIEGINQVQVNSEIGMTFSAALRSILRQDPNIILIGEIRDSETAQIAVRASITGHLVLSTIHTNNSLATIERLLDMDVERYLLSTALTGIISQRLAKQLCPDCHIQRETTQYEKKVFKKYLHQDVPIIWDANPKGCEHCRKGYRGRIAIHEVLELDDDIRSALNNGKLQKKELAKMVYTGKTITMLQDALIKVLEGKTSFEEVYRAIEIENENDENYEQELSIMMPKIEKKEEVEEEESDGLLEIHTAKKDSSSAVKQNSSVASNVDATKEMPKQSVVANKNEAVKIPSAQTAPLQNAKAQGQSNKVVANSTQPNQAVIVNPQNIKAPVNQVATVQNVQKPVVQGSASQKPIQNTPLQPKAQVVNPGMPNNVATPVQAPIAVNAKNSNAPLPVQNVIPKIAGNPPANVKNQQSAPMPQANVSPIPNIVVPTQPPAQINIAKPTPQNLQAPAQAKQPVAAPTQITTQAKALNQMPTQQQQQIQQIMQRPPLEVKK